MNKLDLSFLRKINLKEGDQVEDSVLGKGEVITAKYDVAEVCIHEHGTFWYGMNYGGRIKDLRRLDNLSQKERVKVT